MTVSINLRHRPGPSKVLFAASLMALTLPGPAAATTFTIMDLGDFQPTGVNSCGQVVGYATVASGYTHAILCSEGILQDLGTLGGTTSYAFGINDSSQIVGQAYNTSGNGHAFLYSAGSMTDLGTFLAGGQISSANCINNNGDFAGYGSTSSAIYGILRTGPHTYNLGVNTTALALNDTPNAVGKYKNGTPLAYGVISLGSLGGNLGVCYGINDSNQVCGVAGTTGNAELHAFFSSGGLMTDLNAFGATQSQANGLNNSGQVVGTSGGLAFLYENGVVKDLNTLVPPGTGWSLTSANAITSTGLIVGNGTLNGVSQAFLLVPDTLTGNLKLDALNVNPTKETDLYWSGVTGSSFTVLAATNLYAPLNQWTTLGAGGEITAGHFHYHDADATNNARRFYKLRY